MFAVARRGGGDQGISAQDFVDWARAHVVGQALVKSMEAVSLLGAGADARAILTRVVAPPPYCPAHGYSCRAGCGSKCQGVVTRADHAAARRPPPGVQDRVSGTVREPEHGPDSGACACLTLPGRLSVHRDAKLQAKRALAALSESTQFRVEELASLRHRCVCAPVAAARSSWSSRTSRRTPPSPRRRI